MATISHVLIFDAAIIQGQPLIEDDAYCTKAPSVQLLFNILYSGFFQGENFSQINSYS